MYCQAAPLGELEVVRILATAGADLPALRDVALVLTMRDMLARRSEAVALEAADLHFVEDGSAATLIRSSKTDQAGAGEVRWLARRTVAHLCRWLEAAGISERPVFRPVNKAGTVGSVALDASTVPRLLKQLARRAGLQPVAISGHSVRVGMAQDPAAGGADLLAVMQAGRWKSPTMPARYAERLLSGRGAVARYYERYGA
jgi:site-specific recombinase XerD